MTRERTPAATYRLQLTADFGFADARELVPYLDELGVSHLYLSPIMTAQPGSQSGYDVIDPTRVSAELGGDDELHLLAEATHARGMGLIADFVPNHMAASSLSAWWADLLSNGADSPHAKVFDVDWSADLPAPGESAKLLLPVLGSPLAEVIERGELTCDGTVLRYFDHSFPLAPGTEPGKAVEGTELFELLRRQHYRLAHWLVAAERVNYRRFFDINHLVGLRTEDPDVFEMIHRRLLELVRDGVLDGVRLDHVDGMWDPGGYLERLRAALPEGTYVVVEKILSHDEELPSWPVEGTTGYEFVRALASVFVDREGYRRLADDYARFLGYELAFKDRLVGQKRRVLRELFRGQVERLGRQLTELAAGDLDACDLPPSELVEALYDLTACLAVYRTYASGPVMTDVDAGRIREALGEARRRSREAGDRAFDFLERVLSFEFPAGASEAYRASWTCWVMRWQQLSGPSMAKGLEDTALYQDFRLISLNSVGGEPDPDPGELRVEAFHAHNQRQLERWPSSMITTSTHDSKRSEDVCARIHGLADLSRAWSRALHRWHRITSRHRAHLETSGRVPPRSVEVLIFQTLLGVWPTGATEAGDDLRGRLEGYLLKAVREAKLHTSWLEPADDYEQALIAFVHEVLDDKAFVEDFMKLHERVAACGAVTSLAQLLLKIASPGVADVYQGTEIWSHTLVDPDNRRPVDFELRKRLIDGPGERPADLMRRWRDGRVKLHVTRCGLRFRREHRELFVHGSYRPLVARGRRADLLCAFERSLEDRRVVCVVPRRAPVLMTGQAAPLGRRVWRDTKLAVGNGVWRDVLTDRKHPADAAGELAVGEVFGELPVALLTNS